MVTLSALDVSHTYREVNVHAVRGVTLAVQSGELLAILGPNGAGKSTLLRMMAGLARPDRGSVQLGTSETADVAALSPRTRARSIGLVPQGLVHWPDRTVHDFVAGGRYAHLGVLRGPTTRDLEAVERALLEADVQEFRARSLLELSGGQRQRVLIARSLAQETDVLLVDEPTASLDPAHQLSMFHWLRNLADSGRAVGVVTHDLNLASQCATRIAVLHEGRLHAEGPADSVLTPEVLEPVYGPALHYGHLPTADGLRRPFVVPWRS